MPHQPVRHPRVTQPSATRTRRYAFDLHVLGTPPAFTLSQDQTLHHEEFVPFRDVSVSKGIKCNLLPRRFPLPHPRMIGDSATELPRLSHPRRSCSHTSSTFL